VRPVGLETLAWADPWWDTEVGLLWNMVGAFDDHGVKARSMHLVQPSAWYALGLLQRDGPGDVARAARTIETLCSIQYDAPGTPWHGTFALMYEMPEPVEGAVQWVDYDPNWRQFVGTALWLALDGFAARLPPAVAAQAEVAIRRAVEGEPPERVSPDYTNIALMKAWLDVEAGRVGPGEALAEAVVERFRRTGAFLEYGSPTYYGVDLYALALWRARSSSPRLRGWGAELEAALWRDIARWYHPGLGNLCGPYARSYGMDMTRYASLLGLWIWHATDAIAPPFPDLAGPVDHSADVCFGPMVALLGSQVPEDARRALSALPTPPTQRSVRQIVSEESGFVATGWLGSDVMLGAFAGSRARAEGQYHPATAHWRAPDGSVGWLRFVHAGPLDAEAADGRIRVTVHDHPRRGAQPTTVLSSHPGTFAEDSWSFPGITFAVHAAPAGAGPTFQTPGGTEFDLAVRRAAAP